MHRKAQDKSRMGFKPGGPTSSLTQFPVKLNLRRLLSYESETNTQNHTHIVIRLWKLQKLFYPKMDTKFLSLGKFFKVLFIKDGNFQGTKRNGLQKHRTVTFQVSSRTRRKFYGS